MHHNTEYLPAPEKSNWLKYNQIELLEAPWNEKKTVKDAKIAKSKI